MEGKYIYCHRCGEEEFYDVYYYPPRDHNYYYDELLETYVCSTCGMKNETGADDNFVSENLT
jgi:DNA-directed RNA polymerase subunit RPC12/RpoP